MRDTTTGGPPDPAVLDLPFAVGEAASGPLTWAQSVMWDAMQWFGKEANQFNIGQPLVLAEPVGQARLLASLRGLVEAHQTLRTRYVARSGQPRQEVHATGSYDVAVADGHDDPARVAGELAGRLAETAFDHEAEWPLRVGCVVDGERRVTAVALVGSHLAFDGWAFNTFVDLLRAGLSGDSEQPASSAGVEPPAGVGPSAGAGVPQALEQAAFEGSPAGQQQSRLGLRHWEQGLSTAPASMFDLPRAATGDQPIERHLLDSAAVAAAAATLAARTRTSFSTVLLCLTTLVLTAYNGHDTAVLKLITGNRLDRRSRDLIALNTLDALLAFTVPRDVDLLTAIRQTHRPAFDAYRRAQCDPRAVATVVEETGRRRGVSFDLSTYFNNGHRGNDWAVTGPEPGPDRLAELRRESRYTRLDPLPRSDMKFMVAASNGGAGVCRLGLLVDTTYLPGALGETIVRGIETLLCDAVAGEVGVAEIPGRIGLAPAVRGADWVRTPAGWVRPADVAELVREAAGGVEVAVLAAGPAPGTGLTAYVADASAVPEELHRRVLALLPGRTGVAAPDGYVACASAPPAGAGPDAWRGVPVVARGPGRPA
ncbi:condensation domain-containing protein [Micromonospora carbonacea]|uniref:Condensation domain-containing protein n=1 Tax=Micromonospora carbonacea TaxID=47853 RepID=A0A1C4Y8T5_9ACTN|nr:condensation domain-containing protein [Micromonospora carbonacea]SCF17080.1 Condensation domain-containing protein [Micromonospora carbonacea]